MHAPASPQSAAPIEPRFRVVKTEAAFSLVEVTLAIGIIAFAFVALFGLLPTGMQTFRASIDSTNDSVMVQDMNAMIQVTPWTKKGDRNPGSGIDSLPEGKGGDVYYFDEEGRRTDTKQHASTKKEVVDRRLYQVKLLVEPFSEPSGDGKSTDVVPDARRVIVVIGDYLKPKSQKDFDATNSSQDLKQSFGKTDLRSRPLIVTQMDSSLGD